MKTVLIFSGGMDSTVLAYHLKATGHELSSLGINYGQRHIKELECAGKLAKKVGMDFKIVDLSSIGELFKGNSQTDPKVPVPDGHYAEESMKQTIVPNRNMIMLSVAVGYALSIEAQSVAYAAHAGDHAIYPDCRPEFAEALNKAVFLADWRRVAIDRPFITNSKKEIALMGQSYKVPFEETWSCYKGGKIHCGTCGTCTERKEALKGFDPTDYMQKDLL